ncbi:NmrA family NAD(P)-binding protein [Streptomyces alanosinicus]|uniref:NmrA family transcriptional regulator n=1 Tax=Streptomyces alanosinicus TaxID=68171 RepID=A0A919D0Q3_9ACTN|nr:NAD(P)H-binding protein [Streptomyces alanosinicus]GHE00374.1 NmrA family transcriptional regulator [Streptomyces alanosinicus]
MILVTGAGGNVGGALLGHLRGAGAAVRAAYRDPRRTERVIGAGGQAVTLDLADPDTLGPALDGIDTVFLLAPTGPAQTTLELTMVEAARAAGARVVKLSVWRADEQLTPIARLHRPVEEALFASGLPWTVLRPNFYLQNFLRQSSVREAGQFTLPLVTAPISFIDVDDVARVAARVLTTDGHEGRVYDLTGPRALTYAEAAEQFSEVLGRPVRYVGPADDEARAMMLGRGMPRFQADALIEVARAYRDGGADTVTSTVADLTGRAPLGFADFVRQNRHVFE